MALKTYLELHKYNLINFQAMDLIFHHFREKKQAAHYISSHLKSHFLQLETNGIFNVETGFFSETIFKSQTVDELAKLICDYDYLMQQAPSTTFDLITSEQILNLLIVQLVSMHPSEAEPFLRTYFQQSSFAQSLSDEQRAVTLEKLKNIYVLHYSNSILNLRSI